jgi:transcriptional regulator with XRE-family HTH domain
MAAHDVAQPDNVCHNVPMRDRIVDTDALFELRVNREMTLASLADTAGVSRSLIYKVSSGETQLGDITARRVATALGCDVTDFTHPKPGRTVDPDASAA